MIEKGKLPDIKTSQTPRGRRDLIYDTFPTSLAVLRSIVQDYLRWHNTGPTRASRALSRPARIADARHGKPEWLVQSPSRRADVRLVDFWGAAEVGQNDDAVVVPVPTRSWATHIAEFI
jgi:hypothetical protein